MKNPQQPDDLQNESLAIDPPKPVDEACLPRAVNIGLGTVALTIAGAGAIVLIAGSLTPCVGATRSTKLEWQRRKSQMEQAEREVASSENGGDEQPNLGRQD